MHVTFVAAKFSLSLLIDQKATRCLGDGADAMNCDVVLLMRDEFPIAGFRHRPQQFKIFPIRERMLQG